jgi:hypothetical protein
VELNDRLSVDTPPEIATDGRSVAYVPDRFIVPDLPGIDALVARSIGKGEYSLRNDRFRLYTSQPEALRVVRELRTIGVPAQLDHVFFVHGNDEWCCCHDHPADLLGNPLRGNPLRGNPLRGNPLRGNPLRGNPLRGNPLRGNPLRGNGMPQINGARPAPKVLAPPHGQPTRTPRVVILDTGLAGVHPKKGIDFQPELLTNAAGSVTGASDLPDADGNGWLDPIAGHGTFIAGLIELYAPGCDIVIYKVLSPEGAGMESAIADLIFQLADASHVHHPDILNLSFGGYVLDQAPYLQAAILSAQANKVAVVASAGNDGVCTPTYPAAFPGVISVGSIGPDGPSWFSNYGDWVRACAPGDGVVSAFFAKWDGLNQPADGIDKDRFDGWAEWSGTSFSAPMVAAALARTMQYSGCNTDEAVAHVVDAPHLGRVPGLGTVVNL